MLTCNKACQATILKPITPLSFNNFIANRFVNTFPADGEISNSYQHRYVLQDVLESLIVGVAPSDEQVAIFEVEDVGLCVSGR
jgi:hypothetical protein